MFRSTSDLNISGDVDKPHTSRSCCHFHITMLVLPSNLYQQYWRQNFVFLMFHYLLEGIENL